MDTQILHPGQAKNYGLDYFQVLDDFLSRSLRARINSGGYSVEVVDMLSKLESELLAKLGGASIDEGT